MVTKTLGFLAAVLLCAVAANADTIYNVAGTAVVTGNNACGGPCIETIDFSMQLDEYYTPFTTVPFPEGGYTLSVVPGSSMVSASGPLGLIGGPSLTEIIYSPVSGPANQSVNFIPVTFGGIFGSSYAEIDLLPVANEQPNPFVPYISGAVMWGCSGVCVPDFCNAVACLGPGPLFTEMSLYGTVVNSTAVPTPEPSGAALLILGLAALTMVLFSRKDVNSPSGGHTYRRCLLVY
jgi:hypothetical protein